MIHSAITDDKGAILLLFSLTLRKWTSEKEGQQEAKPRGNPALESKREQESSRLVSFGSDIRGGGGDRGYPTAESLLPLPDG